MPSDPVAVAGKIKTLYSQTKNSNYRFGNKISKLVEDKNPRTVRVRSGKVFLRNPHVEVPRSANFP
ncbi:hypothetical protein M5K25_006673 [Dendrobium thyrsiflorum]|uniref:Uncharacterized protein n=1 Tax=Dendrobium thyrsiflorum TaxID=117978 RepID=A0ABD0VCE4_DENTH